MINETANLTIQELTYENVTAISQSPYGIVVGLLLVFVPIILYLIIGSIAKARTGDGRKLSSPMIASGNFWIGILIMFFGTGSILILTYWFPIWLKIFG